MPTRRATRIREPKVARIARSIGMPDAQASRDDLVLVDAKNANDDDLRHIKRSGVSKTVRRKTKLEKLYDAKALTLDGYKACRWYHDLHAMGFDTVGITANYEGGAGGGQTSFTHLARYREQGQARIDYCYAREGISPMLRPLLEKVVLHGRPIGRLTISFRRAVDQLIERAESMGAIAS